MTCDSEWCTDSDPCFTCAEVDHRNRHPNMDDPDCRTCKLRSLQLNPRTTGARKDPNGTAAPAQPMNSWERGVATDHRGVPYLDGVSGNPIHVKKFAANRKQYEESIRQVRKG